jgi:exonuclease III
MAQVVRIVTFNIENLDDVPGQEPTLADRIARMTPQLNRLRADILCLQEVHGQEQAGEPRKLLALEELLAGTPYSDFEMVSTKTADGEQHLYISQSLLEFYNGTEIHNEKLHDESRAFASDIKFPESDHAPVVAEFMFP